jgi:putative salt-induced outer membrane protein YdiY
MTKRFTHATILITLLCLAARADQLTLKNGDRLTGKIVKSDAKTLVIKSDLAGEVSVPWDAVTGITSDERLYLQLSDGRTVAGEVASTGDRIEIKADNSTTVETTKAQVQALRSREEQTAYERLQNPGWLELWSGSADLGLALTTGNSKTLNLALGTAISRETRRDKTSFYAAALYARDSTSGEARTTANAARGGLRYDRNINGRWFGYAFTDLERNRLQDLSLRLVLGGGLGHHAINTERAQLDILGGADWNREYFREPFPDRSSAEVQAGQTFAYKLSERTSLKEQFFVFPNLSNGGEYRLNFDTSVVTAITRRVGWQLTVSDRYLSNPPLGLQKNDLLLTTGLNFKIGGAPGK